MGPVHSYYHYLPPVQYFKDHPEWYSLVDGERVSSGGQLCLTNPEMLQELVE
ncbi:MAG: DUF4838 domain-containing protein, partial [Bacteroidetes bacterium]|nr:DUF4838 domain-containing protein [Bacteroidota bacterium]